MEQHFNSVVEIKVKRVDLKFSINLGNIFALLSITCMEINFITCQAH